MSQNEYQYLDVARSYVVIGDMDNACVHYAKVSQDHPGEVAEAGFFEAYMSYKSLLEEKDGASATNAFKAMAACLKDAVNCIKESGKEELGQVMILTALVKAYTPITRFLFTQRISTTSSTIETGVLGLYALGDAIKAKYGSNPEAMKQAVEAWKEGVALQRQFYGYKYNGVTPEPYAEKIQKVEPAYTMPNKAGCISVGNK